MGTATNGEYILDPMELADATRRASERARASGALVPLGTQVRTMTRDGIPFVVRVSDNLQHKAPVSDTAEATGDPFSPPYEDDLYVGTISATHAALLNKFNVLEDHLLLVTREWAEQAAMLDRTDYHALLLGLASMDGLAFYNGGAEAGASQPHKHLQIVPLPLAETVPDVPLEGLFEAAEWRHGVGRVPGLPFEHRVQRIDPSWWQDPAHGAKHLQAAAETLWEDLGFDPSGDRQPAPYNLLATRRWLWLVPRSTAGWRGLPVNALAYAGALIAQNEQAYQCLSEAGPLNLLTDCAIARCAASMHHEPAR